MSEISLQSWLDHGFVHLPIWGYVVLALGLTHITIASVTIFLHRHQAHRALDLHPLVGHFFRFWLWLTTGMVTKQWVAVHRKHHAKVETPEDPHSPQVKGISTVLWQGAELYRAEAEKPQTLDKYGHGTPDDWLERRLYTGHPLLGVALMLTIDIALLGPVGLAIWGVQMMWIPFWAAGVINGVGHWGGYRNYESKDTSTNIVPVALLIGGEELHNNHHAFPSSAKFSTKWWEFDLGWFYIRTLSALGLARVKKVAPRPVIVPYKEDVDMETVRAVILNRFHVMAHFAGEVMVPVMREELRRADASCRRMLKQGRRLLVRDISMMDANARGRLDLALAVSQRLRTVYQYRQALQDIWARSAASHEHLRHALQEWCVQAEATGIQALESFARRLRGYSLQAA
ncbi:MAG TPA: fatty acid desaturase [Gammaproteobacteria bacterium]|nr:fatty acid desaturase [Gammaproteobacteria bacterium]